jgi:hypothetical protein
MSKEQDNLIDLIRKVVKELERVRLTGDVISEQTAFNKLKSLVERR